MPLPKRGCLRVFDQLDQILDQSDVIHVCTPPLTHEAIAISALTKGKFVIVEKPLTGFFGEGIEEFHGDPFPRQIALDHSLESIRRIIDAEKKSKGKLLYAEKWIYAPAIQKEREIIEKTGAQILWMHGEEAHSGSSASTYGYWKFSGGGAMVGKGCHPLSAALYLKGSKEEQEIKSPSNRDGLCPRPCPDPGEELHRPGSYPGDYTDIEDFSTMHVRSKMEWWRILRFGHRPGWNPQLDRGSRQQSPDPLQHQSEHGHADL